MKTATNLITCTTVLICLTATPLFACETNDCNNRPEVKDLEAVPAAPSKNEDLFKPRTREMNISDFVTGEQKPEGKEMVPAPQNSGPTGEQKIKKLLEPKGCSNENCTD